MSERETLMNRIQVCDFALNDAALFLDVHPGDKAALDYYRKHMELHRQATEAYAAKYGPVSRGDCVDAPRWRWTDGPWPWQYEEA